MTEEEDSRSDIVRMKVWRKKAGAKLLFYDMKLFGFYKK